MIFKVRENTSKIHKRCHEIHENTQIPIKIHEIRSKFANALTEALKCPKFPHNLPFFV